MYRKPIAEEYLLLTKEWEAAEKETIVDNLTKILCKHYPACQSFNDRQKLISELTYSNKHTVYAWTNLSRSNVKLPLLKLCQIAKELNEEVENFFKTNNDEGKESIMEKFAIKLVKGDNSTILETFENKQDALAAGEKYRSKYTRERGLISCIQAVFDEDGNIVGIGYKLIDSWS